MEEKSMELVEAQKYYQLGGKLDRVSFEKVNRTRQELDEGGKPKVRETSLAQAENIARHSKLELTQEQEILYAVLRETKVSTLPENTETNPPSAMEDQILLAEIFLSTNDYSNYEALINAYPNIFK